MDWKVNPNLQKRDKKKVTARKERVGRFSRLVDSHLLGVIVRVTNVLSRYSHSFIKLFKIH
jgi:hypothetical protein